VDARDDTRDAGTAVEEARVSAVALTLRTPLYRGATAALFLSGLGTSAAAPQIASFLVTELDASLTTAGLFYLTTLTSVVAGYLVGSRSDRTGRRMGLFRWCAVAGFAGWTAISVSTHLWMPFVLNAVVLSFAGAAASQLFAALHDELSARPRPGNDGVVAVARMALTAGWVVGPVAGSLLAAHVSLRAMLFATAVCSLAQIVPLGRSRTVAPQHSKPAGGQRPDLRTMAPLLAFTGLYVCVYAGEAIKYAYLPIYMRDDLALSSGVAGAVIGVQPLVEIVLMPIAVLVAARVGSLRLMILGAGFGVGANACFAFADSALPLFAGQVLMGGVWGVFAALGIIVAQRLLPTAVATASAIFMSSTAVSQAIGGTLGGLGVQVLGLPLVFLVPGAFAGVACLGLAVMARRRPEL
jgi:MFS transporter, SET family, sugar efflux transporter